MAHSTAVDTTEAAVRTLADAGFDLAHGFAAHAIREPGWELLATAPPLGLLIGNTRALWPRFVAAMRDPALAAEPAPLDHYTESAIEAAFPGARIYYAHRRYGAGFLPFQRLAVASGLGALAPTRLVIHPIYGPWFALRAVVLLDGRPPVRVPIAQPCTCTAACTIAVERAEAVGTWEAWRAVRDACSLRAWRYSDAQLRYHGTHVFEPE